MKNNNLDAKGLADGRSLLTFSSVHFVLLIYHFNFQSSKFLKKIKEVGENRMKGKGHDIYKHCMRCGTFLVL